MNCITRLLYFFPRLITFFYPSANRVHNNLDTCWKRDVRNFHRKLPFYVALSTNTKPKKSRLVRHLFAYYFIFFIGDIFASPVFFYQFTFYTAFVLLGRVYGIGTCKTKINYFAKWVGRIFVLFFVASLALAHGNGTNKKREDGWACLRLRTSEIYTCWVTLITKVMRLDWNYY